MHTACTLHVHTACAHCVCTLRVHRIYEYIPFPIPKPPTEPASPPLPCPPFLPPPSLLPLAASRPPPPALLTSRADVPCAEASWARRT